MGFKIAVGGGSPSGNTITFYKDGTEVASKGGEYFVVNEDGTFSLSAYNLSSLTGLINSWGSYPTGGSIDSGNGTCIVTLANGKKLTGTAIASQGGAYTLDDLEFVVNTDLVFLSDILLARNPTLDLHAATKQYVDNAALNGAADEGHTHAYTDVTDLGTVATKDTGTSAGNVPILGTGGKLSETLIPNLAITDTFTADSESAMLALTVQQGDVCIRTDLNKSFICTGATGTGGSVTVDDWQELASPPDAVSSVNGQLGTVVINAVPDDGNAGDVLTAQTDGYGWTTGKYTGSITGNGSTKAFTITHNLGTTAVVVTAGQVLTDDSLCEVQVDTDVVSESAVVVTFAVAPADQAVYKITCRL